MASRRKSSGQMSHSTFCYNTCTSVITLLLIIITHKIVLFDESIDQQDEFLLNMAKRYVSTLQLILAYGMVFPRCWLGRWVRPSTYWQMATQVVTWVVINTANWVHILVPADGNAPCCPQVWLPTRIIRFCIINQSPCSQLSSQLCPSLMQRNLRNNGVLRNKRSNK